MGIDDGIFTEAVAAVSAIDFTRAKTSDLASVFESTIRHIGGMISAYELSDRKHSILLEKAKQLADQLAFAWVGVSFFLPKEIHWCCCLVDPLPEEKRHPLWTHQRQHKYTS